MVKGMLTDIRILFSLNKIYTWSRIVHTFLFMACGDIEGITQLK